MILTMIIRREKMRASTVRLVRAAIVGMLLLTVAASPCHAGSGRTYRLGDLPTCVSLAEQGRTGLTLQLEIGELQLTPTITKGGSFVLISFKDCARSQSVGEPNLPMTNRLIAIPLGCSIGVDVTDIETEEISLDDLGIEAPLMPVQPPLFKSEDPALVPFEYRDEVYEMSGFYSLPRAEARPVGMMRGIRLALVSLSPVEYSPTDNKIRVAKRMTVKIEYTDPDWDATSERYRKSYSPFFEPVYERIINYESAAYGDADDLTSYPVKYVIVSDSMFDIFLQPFAEWKTKRGFEVITAHTDVIGTSNTQIKSYLENLYNTSDPKPSFVLLVGDAQQIEPFWIGNPYRHFTDLTFCEYDGDDFPDVYYGRFSAQSPIFLQPQIEKTLEYERYEMPDPSYLGEVTLIAGVDYWYAETHGNGQINYGANLYFNAAHGIDPHIWLYPASDEPGASDAIIQTVNDGVGFINYTAHCSHDGFGAPAFDKNDILSLTNAHMYLLGIGNCCLSNTFGTDYSTPCFGEVWMYTADRGGIGYIGGTNSTAWDEDYWWAVGYGPVVAAGASYEETGLGAYDGLFHDHGEPVTNHYIVNDAIIFCGNLAVTESGSSLTDYYWEIYHLLGDPSLMTYVGVPTENNISHPDTIRLSDTSVVVHADPSSYVGISVDGSLHGAGYIDESGSVEIQLVQFDTVELAEIVVCAQNRVPYMSTIQVALDVSQYICGDTDGTGTIDIDDVVYLIEYIFNDGPPPDPPESGNTDCVSVSGLIDIDDVVYLIEYMFGGGPGPCDPDGNGVPDC